MNDAASRHPVLARIGLLAGALGLLAAAACAPEQRYDTLSFFFDGVPPPPGVLPAEPDPAAASRHDVVTEVGFTPVVQRPTSLQPVVYVHTPVRRRECRECHDTAGTMAVLGNGAQLCDKCHYEQRVREGWDHGPINLGTCIPCHAAHSSPYEHLLEQPLPGLCLECHQADMDRNEEYHTIPNVDACTECHDPHSMY